MENANVVKATNLKNRISSGTKDLDKSKKLSTGAVWFLGCIVLVMIFMGVGYVFDLSVIRFVLPVVSTVIIVFVNTMVVKSPRNKWLLVIGIIVTVVLSTSFGYLFLATGKSVQYEAELEIKNYKTVIKGQEDVFVQVGRVVEILNKGKADASTNAQSEKMGSFSGKKSSSDGSANYVENRFWTLKDKYGYEIDNLQNSAKTSELKIKKAKNLLVQLEQKMTERPSSSEELKNYTKEFESQFIVLNQILDNFQNPSKEVGLTIKSLNGFKEGELNIQPTGNTDFIQSQKKAMDKMKQWIQDKIDQIEDIQLDMTKYEDKSKGLRLYEKGNFESVFVCMQHFEKNVHWLLIALLLDMFPYIAFLIHYRKRKEIDELEAEYYLLLEQIQAEEKLEKK